MDTIQLLCEISVLKQKMDKAEAFLEELVEYLLVTCKDDDYITPEVICRKLAKYGYIELENGYWVNPLADRKTEPQFDKDINVRSKEPQTVVRLKHFKCPKCGRSDYIRSFEDWGIDGSIYKYKCINCNTYIKDEPQTEDLQDWKDRMWAEAVVTEPQTD